MSNYDTGVDEGVADTSKDFDINDHTTLRDIEEQIKD